MSKPARNQPDMWAGPGLLPEPLFAATLQRHGLGPR
jgi:hypothetical protein